MQARAQNKGLHRKHFFPQVCTLKGRLALSSLSNGEDALPSFHSLMKSAPMNKPYQVGEGKWYLMQFVTKCRCCGPRRFLVCESGVIRTKLKRISLLEVLDCNQDQDELEYTLVDQRLNSEKN